MRKTDRMRTDW